MLAAGHDLRRLLHSEAVNRAWLLPATQHHPHLRSRGGPDLHPLDQLDPHGPHHRSCGRLPEWHSHWQCLWSCSHLRHGKDYALSTRIHCLANVKIS